MRKIAYSMGAAGCLMITSICAYLASRDGESAHYLPGLTDEEPETPISAPYSLEDLVQRSPTYFPPLPDGTMPPELMELASAASAAYEPIIVEDAPVEPPPPAAIGGGTVPGRTVRMVNGAQPPRPDEEPGEERVMPYAYDLPWLPSLVEHHDHHASCPYTSRCGLSHYR